MEISPGALKGGKRGPNRPEYKKTVWANGQTKNVQNGVQRWPKNYQNRLKIAFWPDKSALRAHFWLEVVVKHRITTWASIQTSQRGQNRPKSNKNRLHRSHIWDIMGLAWGPNWSVWLSLVPFQPCSQLFHKNIFWTGEHPGGGKDPVKPVDLILCMVELDSPEV